MTTASLRTLIATRSKRRQSVSHLERKLVLETCKTLNGGKALRRTRSKRLRAIVAAGVVS